MARGEILNDVEYEDITGHSDEGAESDDDGISKGGADPAISLLSKKKDAEKFRILKSHLLADQEASQSWRTQATDDFGFVAGDQLSEEDKQLLDAQQRPHVTFNRVGTILKAVAGMEINGRHEIQFLPRNNDDTEANEVLSAASKWMADGCDAEDEQSQAFQDASVVGIGVTESRFTYDDDPDGMYVEESFDPREFYWDRTARKKNLTDARRMSRVRRMPLADAMQLFPGMSRFDLDAGWAVWEGMGNDSKSIEEKRIRDGNDSVAEHDDKNEVTIVHTQWWEREPYWLVADIATNSKMEMTEDEYRKLKSRFEVLSRAMGVPMPIHGVRLTRKRFYQAFLGAKYLNGGPAPCGQQFSWGVITGEYDKKQRMFYGLIRVMRDPQMWANKFMSQIMHIMNSTAKGGILAETGAFDDQREAEETYAQPEAITWLAEGALSGDKPKIMEKPGKGDAAAYVNLLALAISSIKDVTGINPELLGQQDQNQPGILEHMRKQAGMTVLATQFDALRRFLKIVGRKRLHFIQNRMSDGRLIRVVGQDYTAAVPLAREKTTGTYDVIVDDAPTSPNQKEANWAIIQPMLAVFKDQLMANPAVFAMILRYSPLPAPLVTAIEKSIKSATEDPSKAQEAEQMKQLGVQKLVAEINKDQSTAELNLAKAGSSQATAQYDLAMAQKMLQNGNLDGLKEYITAKEAEARVAKLHIDSAKGAADADYSSAKADRERVKAALEPQQLAAEAVRARAQAVTAARQSQMDEHDHHRRGNLENMEAQVGMLSTVAKAHRDMAAAHKDRQMAAQPNGQQ